MHDLQKHILKKLTLLGKARYRDLKPKSVEGNMFMYHLKKIISSGYISKQTGAYVLSAKGKQYVDRVTLKSFDERIQPKIVTLLVLTNKKGEYLIYKRKRQPLINQFGFPYGKIHLEERIQESAGRELKEKVGLTGVLKHRGDIYLHISDEEKLITHMLCHIFVGKNIVGKFIEDSSIGTCSWMSTNDMKQRKLMPGVAQIIKLLSKSKNHFFAEYFLNTTEEY
ncbi:NUDIX hydrolase [Patescibacteria group bacterium]